MWTYSLALSLSLSLMNGTGERQILYTNTHIMHMDGRMGTRTLRMDLYLFLKIERFTLMFGCFVVWRVSVCIMCVWLGFASTWLASEKSSKDFDVTEMELWFHIRMHYGLLSFKYLHTSDYYYSYCRMPLRIQCISNEIWIQCAHANDILHKRTIECSNDSRQSIAGKSLVKSISSI